jgi:hypothetical protein
MKRSAQVAGAVVVLWVVASNFNAGAAEVTTAQSDAPPTPPRKVTPAGDIILTNKAISFIDLQGRGYTNVDFVKVNLDGLVWRDKEGMGQVSLTNLDRGFLAGLGVDDDRYLLRMYLLPACRYPRRRNKRRSRRVMHCVRQTRRLDSSIRCLGLNAEKLGCQPDF